MEKTSSIEKTLSQADGAEITLQPSNYSATAVFSITAEEDKATRRKLDLVLMPLLGFCYMLQFLDKMTLSYSALLGIIKDAVGSGSGTPSITPVLTRRAETGRIRLLLGWQHLLLRLLVLVFSSIILDGPLPNWKVPLHLGAPLGCRAHVPRGREQLRRSHGCKILSRYGRSVRGTWLLAPHEHVLPSLRATFSTWIVVRWQLNREHHRRCSGLCYWHRRYLDRKLETFIAGIWSHHSHLVHSHDPASS